MPYYSGTQPITFSLSTWEEESLISRLGSFLSVADLMQIVVLVDAKLVNIALGSKEGLNKGIEPDGSDKMISVSGHRTLFSADTNSKYWRLIRKGTTAAFQYKNIRLTSWLNISLFIIL